MSDRETPGRNEMDRDPADRAYVRAEDMLDDAQARAARRARVLAAVATQPAAPAGLPLRHRAQFGRGGWLIAASVAGISVLVALQIRSPFPAPQPAAPPAAALAPVPAGPSETTPPARTARTTETEASKQDASGLPKASRAAPPGSGTAKPAMPPLAPQAPAVPAASPPAAAPAPLAVPPVEHRFEEPRPPAAARAAAATASNSEINELVVTSERRNLPRDEKAEQLRGAAEAGRADEVAALLAEGAPVDLPDEAGDTALMKSVRADQPAAAVLLRRHGASLDRRNHAGESARTLAAIVGDPEMDQALSLKR